jgi:hypothetical protein
MINSILLIDDENLFHLVFEDACSLLDIALHLQSISSVEEAEKLFRGYSEGTGKKPDCAFVDFNLIGSKYDGIELIRKVNVEFGNGVVIGIISSSADKAEIEKAKSVGAQFWIVKSDEIEPRLNEFKKDFASYKDKSAPFKVYT